MSLEEFNNKSEESALDVYTEESSLKAVNTPISDKNTAGQGALLSAEGSDVVGRFQEIEQQTTEQQATILQEITDKVHAHTVRTSQQAVEMMLLNPLTDEVNADQAVIGLAAMQENKDNSRLQLATEMGIKPSGDEGAEAEEVRLDSAALAHAIQERTKLKQDIVNGELLSTNPGSLNALGDFLEIMVPFSEGILTADTIGDIKAGDVTSAKEALTLLGNSKMDLRNHFETLNFTEQGEFIQKLATVVNDSRGIVFTNDNDLAQKDLFNTIVEGGYYGPGDQALDNIIGVLDWVGLGGLIKAPTRLVRLGTKTVDMASAMKRRVMRSSSQPTSLFKTVSDTNPEEARKLHAQAVLDETGESAEVLHGASREDAIVDGVAPQVRTAEGIVEDKVENVDKFVKEITGHDGLIDLSIEEVSAAVKASSSQIDKVTGVTARGSMSTAPVTKPDGTLVYSTVYGPSDSAYKSPQNAIDTVLHSLRDFDVRESNLTLLQKVGDEYVPTTLKEVQGKQALRDSFVKSKKRLPEELRRENFKDDFLVQTNFEHAFDQQSVAWDKLQVKRNLFDHVPLFNRGKKGGTSVNRYFADAHSMFDPRITLGANVVVDKASAIEKALVEVGEKFTKNFQALAPDRQELVHDIIKSQNKNEKALTYQQLKAKGVSPEEAKVLDAWKETWDNVYWLENKDLVKNLRAGNYQLYTDAINGTSLVARPVGKAAAGNAAKAYNPATGKIDRLTPQQLDDLYDTGGTMANLRRTEDLGGESFDFVISTNKQDGDYLRRLRDDDQVLNYKEGYYTVRYKDAHIIEKQMLDEFGVPTGRTQALKTAPNLKAADLTAENMNRANKEANVKYVARSNKDNTIQGMDDDYWSIQASTGRTSQRVRGERLGTSGPNIAENTMGAVEGPVESLLNSVRSISRRTSTRDYIERYKLRFMDNYKEMMPKDQFGQPKFPSNAEELRASGRETSKAMADARSNLEYINYLENGYRNSLDDVWKASLNGLADAMGKFSPAAEGVLRATVDEVSSPTGWLRGRAFDAYLALSPLRQFVIQGHQSTLLAANFPKYVLSKNLTKDMSMIHLDIILGKAPGTRKLVPKAVLRELDEAADMIAEYKRSGLDAAIDRQNLVEKGMDQLVETTRFKKGKALHAAVVGNARKLGFDAGERINIMSSWLAHRNEAIQAGKSMKDARVFDEVMGKARNYTFNMNAAGDMPYNKNSLSLIFQFMQVPHKAVTQVLTNRVLTGQERARLAAYNAIMLPLPIGFGVGIFGSLLEDADEDTKDFVLNGLEGFMFNKIAQTLFDDDTRVDFGSLAAVDPHAPLDLIHSIMTSDITEIVKGAPAIQLWAGYNPRATNVIREVARFVTAPQDMELKDLGTLAHTFASLSSGYAGMSQAYREKYVQNYAKRYSSSGGVSDPSITTPEMIAKAFGFRSLHEAINSSVSQKVYEASKSARDDVSNLYKLQKQHMVREGMNTDSAEWNTEMLRAFWLATDFTGGQKEEYMKLMMRDAKKGDSGILSQIVNNLDMVSPEDLKAFIGISGLDPQLGEAVDFMLEQKRLGEDE
jgi:hypothetical protein